MADELKPCPFCGWEHISWMVDRLSYDFIEYAAHCGNCDTNGATANTREQAAQAWNRRDARAPGVQIPSEVAETIRIALLHQVAQYSYFSPALAQVMTVDGMRSKRNDAEAALNWLAQAQGTA